MAPPCRGSLQAELGACRPGRSATRATGPRYSGAIPRRTLNGDLEDDALWEVQPVRVDQCICFVIEASKFRNQLFRCVLRRRKTTYQVNWKTDQHAVPVIEPGYHQTRFLTDVTVETGTPSMDRAVVGS